MARESRLLALLNKPEYLFRPSQILRRLHFELGRRGLRSEKEHLALPWGTSFRVHSHEAIGRSLLTTGVYDLAVSEMLWRLTPNGAIAVDVGANIGYMTTILADRVGAGGTVFSYEPHPALVEMLEENVGSFDNVVIRPVAVSNESGTAMLSIPTTFDGNAGVATLEIPDSAGNAFPVKRVRLDDEFPDRVIAVLKIDVEGHEQSVLQGARALLETRRVSNIVFEEHRPGESPVVDLLESFGYEVFDLRKELFGPALLPRDNTIVRPATFDAPSCVATFDAEGLISSTARRGYDCLRAHPRSR